MILAGLAAVFFWQYLTPLKSGRAWLWEDFIQFTYPVRFFAATSIIRGEFPFWNPYVFGGMPFFADIQTAVLYPFNLLQTLFAGPDSLSPRVVQFFLVFHFFLAAWFSFRYLRYLKLSAESSLLGAVIFAFSGFLVTHAIHLNFINVFVWLPLILEMFQRALDTGRHRWAVLCALALGVSTMGGYPQYTLYICYVLGLQWLCHELEVHRENGWSLSGTIKRLAVLVAVAAFGVGLNAFNWLPAAELARYTPRSSMTWEASAEHSLHPLFLVKLLSPGFFGRQLPTANTYWAGGYSAFWETCLFVGVLPLTLALWALSGIRRDRSVRFHAVLAASSLLLALGKYGGLYRLFFEFAPGFGRFRIPGRFAALVSFALAMLAAYGCEALLRKTKSGEGRAIHGPMFLAAGSGGVLLVLFVLLKAGALNGLCDGALLRPEVKAMASGAVLESIMWTALAALILWPAGRSGRFTFAWAGSIVLCTFVELASFGRPFLAGDTDPAVYYADTPMVKELKKDLDRELFRVNARSLENPGVMVLPRNQGSIARLFLLEGYNPLQLKRRLGEVQVDRQFDLLNVKYKIAINYESRSVGLAAHGAYLPRAFLLHRWRVLKDDASILATLNDPSFDHRSEAVLETEPGIDTPSTQEHIESEAVIKSYAQNEITVETKSPAAGILVLSEWEYPAWKAWVDGTPVAVLRTDYALRGVALEAGNHIVHFAYVSDSFRLGVIVSLVAAVALAVLALLSARFGRRW